MGFPTASLCTWDTLVGENELFGKDIAKQLSTIKEEGKHFGFLTNGGNNSGYRGRGKRYRGRGRGGRWRGGPVY